VKHDPRIAELFSKLLLKERKAKGLSQEGLAALAGLDRSAVGQLERKETAPRLETVIRLAGALEIDPCRLMPPLRWSPPSAPTSGGFVSQ
jgi:transcriptional regulator with XRE-family HTH domain